MHAVTIEILVGTHVSANFKAAAEQAQANGKSHFDYEGTNFRLDIQNGKIKKVLAVLDGFTALLPSVFKEELEASFVTVKSEVPPKLLAKPGRYVGDNFGFPGAACAVLPEDRLPSDPPIYANGGDFKAVVGLYKKVMTGQLEPDHNGNL